MMTAAHVEVTVVGPDGTLWRGAADVALSPAEPPAPPAPPEPPPAPEPPPVAVVAVPGVHDVRRPAELVAAFPGVRLTREFVPNVLSTPGSLIPRVRALLQPSWDAGLVPVWSLKLDPAQVMSGAWHSWVRELAEWLDVHPANELVIWHEPENDPVHGGGAFVPYFNRIAALIRERTTRVPLIYASMAYQWLPGQRPGSSVKGRTDNPAWWTGCAADLLCTDVYSGGSVPLGTTLAEHPGITRWLAGVVGPEADWGVTERGFLAPAGITMTTAMAVTRADAIRREAAWLTGTAPGRRVRRYVYWNTPGTEGNPNIVLDKARGEPALAELVAGLAAAGG